MEFLMTYGWAIIVVITAIATLIFLLGNPNEFSGDFCRLPPGFKCEGFAIQGSNVIFRITNGLGVNLVSSKLSVINSNVGPCIESSDIALGSLQTATYSVQCDNTQGTVGPFRGDIIFTYQRADSGLLLSVNGNIKGGGAGEGGNLPQGGACDGDGDSYKATGVCGGNDCDNNDDDINPGATEICGNGIDENCNGNGDDICGPAPGCDDDTDNYLDTSCSGGNDCNDNNANIHPGAIEICNNIDDNCDAIIDGFTQACPDIGVCLGTGATQTC